MEFWNLVTEIWNNDIARTFSVAIVVVFSLSLLGFRVSSLAALNRHGSTLCTTLGVLGTFTGIFLGLLEFDVAEIDDSVPELLEGLKVAFSTSIVGLGTAVLLRIVQPLVPAHSNGDAEATPETIHRTLRRIEEAIRQSSEKNLSALASLRQAVSTDNDNSLVTEVQTLRISVEDGNRQLVDQFKSFTEKMADDNSRALIEALENVIRDFNTQLNDQFGDNFKQLNHAVQALLEWQDRYRRHVETLESRIEAAVQALQDSEIALRAIAQHSTRIPEAVTSMRDLFDRLAAATERLPGALDEIGNRTKELRAILEAVAGLGDRAMNAFPTIENNVKLLTESLKATVDSHTETIHNSASEMQKQHQEQLRQVKQMIDGQFQRFDSQMQSEMTRSIEAMGRHLASLSEKFVTDYEPLTVKLRELLNAVDRQRP